jgi:hypothetical protein
MKVEGPRPPHPSQARDEPLDGAAAGYDALTGLRQEVAQAAMAAVTASGVSSCGKWPTPGSSRHS